MARRRILIMGAAGRDFHDFNVVYRDDPAVEVVAFTATQIPGHRRPALPGRARPAPCIRTASRSSPRPSSKASSATSGRDGRLRLQRRQPRDGHARRLAGARGGRRLLAPRPEPAPCSRAAVRSSPSGATRTGSGKSQTTRFIAAPPGRARPDAGRHPPSDAVRRPRRPARPALRDLRRPRPRTRPRSRSARNTSPTSTPVASSTPASTTRRSCARPRPRPTSSSGTAGTTTSRSTGRTCTIVVADPLRAGDERRYHPGETNIRMADVVAHQQDRFRRPGDGRGRPGVDRRGEPAGRGPDRPLGPDPRRPADQGTPRRGRRGRPDPDPRRDDLRGRHRRRATGSGQPSSSTRGRRRSVPSATSSIAIRRSSRSSRRWATAPTPDRASSQATPQRGRCRPGPVGDADRPDPRPRTSTSRSLGSGTSSRRSTGLPLGRAHRADPATRAGARTLVGALTTMTTLLGTAAVRTATAPRHFLTLDDLGPRGLRALLDLTARLKREPAAFRNSLAGGRVGMIFDKPSTRTRVSFESAAWMLGMLPIVLRPDELQLGRGETIADTARALSLYLDALDGPDRLAGVGRGARGGGLHPGRQRPDQRAPPVPGAGRRDDDRGGVRRARRPSGSPSSATATMSAIP